MPPVLLMTLAMVPTPPRETETRSWNRTPGVSGTSKEWLATIDGLVWKKQ